jgi:hypothetical protein
MEKNMPTYMYQEIGSDRNFEDKLTFEAVDDEQASNICSKIRMYVKSTIPCNFRRLTEKECKEKEHFDIHLRLIRVKQLKDDNYLSLEVEEIKEILGVKSTEKIKYCDSNLAYYCDV